MKATNPIPVILQVQTIQVTHHPHIQITAHILITARIQTIAITQALRYIDSQHIAKLYETGLYNGRTYEIITYFRNGSLQGKRFTLDGLKKTIIPSVNEALRVLHDTGTIHKDLKPSNIMYLNNYSGVALIDFGISSVVDEGNTVLVTKTGMTPEYSAPETFRGLFLEESDYYSFGITLYELFCGKTPYDVSSFVRDYLSVKNQSIPSLNKVYAVFKEFVEISKADTEDLLKDLLAYAKRYHTLLIGGTGNRIIDGCIYRLNRLETSVIRPFFLEVLRLSDEGKLSTDELAEIFTITESYLFRRTICDLPTNSLNKTFLMLHKEILRYDGTENAYVDKLKYALLSKKERVRFPDDEEFGRSFTERQIYLMQSKNKIYILERLENFGTAEDKDKPQFAQMPKEQDKDVYRHFDEGDYSIEHVMPQHLTPAWIEELGEDFEQIHEIWLHRIANLTLTAYNSKYSNSTFADKKNMKNGFVDSGIRMNTYISRNESWTLTQLEERSDYLKNRALSIWKLPETEYRPAEKELDFFTLADDTSLSNRFISKFVYKNTEQPVSSWVEMLQKVLQILYDEDKSILIQLGVSNENGVAQFFSYNENSFRKAVEISEGLYVYTNTNTSSKLNLLEKLFGMYNIDLTELGFYLRNTADELENESGTRYEIRRKYWSYALPKIKEVNVENGAFSNVDFSKENWINGYIGIAGFNICCVANYDSARVEMVFSKADKSVNKETFDKLKQYKAEVEKALGSQIVWQRGEDQKSSKVFVQLDGVSIAEENDWLRMSDFHAEWSKKFIDTLVPYIKN